MRQFSFMCEEIERHSQICLNSKNICDLHSTVEHITGKKFRFHFLQKWQINLSWFSFCEQLENWTRWRAKPTTTTKIENFRWVLRGHDPIKENIKRWTWHVMPTLPSLPISLSANPTRWADFNKFFDVGEQKLKMGDLKIPLGCGQRSQKATPESKGEPELD